MSAVSGKLIGDIVTDLLQFGNWWSFQSHYFEKKMFGGHKIEILSFTCTQWETIKQEWFKTALMKRRCFKENSCHEI